MKIKFLEDMEHQDLNTDYLDKAFSKNQKFLNETKSTYQNNHYYMNELENLCKDLYANKVSNIDDKMRDVSNIGKLRSTKSELEVALCLAKRGKTVELICDNQWKSPPDMKVFDDDCGETYVEVARFKGEIENLLSKKLKEAIIEKNLPFNVGLEYSGIFFTNVSDKKSYQAKECAIEKAVKEISEKLSGLDKKSIPTIFQIDEISVEVNLSDTSTGNIVKCQSNGFQPIDEKAILSHLRNKILDKASKVNDWKEEDKKKNYVLAISLDDFWTDEHHLFRVLFGTRIANDQYIKKEEKQVPQKFSDMIESAKQKGWAKFLEENILPNKECYLDFIEKGILFTHQETNCISGVMLYKSTSLVTYIPNPFANNSINNVGMISFVIP